MANNFRKSTLYGGFFLILLGIILILQRIDFIDFWHLFAKYWPVLLILLGLYIIINSFRRTTLNESSIMPDQTKNGEKIIHSNTFGDIKMAIDDSDFQGGQIRTVFGTIKVDAGKIAISKGERKLILGATFGDIKLNLPRNLPVKVSARIIIGDVEVFDREQDGFNQSLTYQTDNFDTADARLHVICNLVFGDIRVM